MSWSIKTRGPKDTVSSKVSQEFDRLNAAKDQAATAEEKQALKTAQPQALAMIARQKPAAGHGLQVEVSYYADETREHLSMAVAQQAL
jgi:hypothetical protein